MKCAETSVSVSSDGTNSLASDLNETTTADGASIIVVDWKEPSDPQRPVNWSFTRKWAIVTATSLATFMVSFGSSVYSAATSQLQTDFDISATISSLGISLYVLGFAFGPLVWGPASELYGKIRPLWVGYLLFCACQIPCALARNISTLLAFRFLAGLGGSSILAILGGMYVDLFLDPTERGISTAIFSLATFSGPAAGPIIGNLVTVHHGWPFTAWITLIGGVFFGAIAYAVTPETSEGVILRRKAQRLRKDTGNVGYRAKCEHEHPGISTFVQKYLTKPPRMFLQEPILIFFTIYMSLAYGIIYLTFTMYPLAFVRDRGWSPIKGSMPFLGILVGVTVACVLLAVHSICYVSPKFSQTGVHLPERRLPPMILGSAILPAGELDTVQAW
ncbi:Polyamine transporter [Pyrenophora tritici-repentis]|nr:Polyamine transporter [Pyrenophora tritici-repentis]